MFVSEETVCVFWVSSLAYPNSLGTKDYVVVVVVVVDIFTYLNHFLILPHFEGQAWCSGEKPTH